MPDADIAMCRQVEKLTGLKAKPLVLELTDESLPHYPFAYMSGPGRLQFTDDDVVALRKYLTGGGFLMVDDLWGPDELQHVREEIRRVVPEHEAKELPLEHELFHCVFSIAEKPQVPSIATAIQGRESGITWEPYAGAKSRDAQYLAITDDNERIRVLICHNTDLGDGWERWSADEWYASEFSAKRAFPMGINIVFYALTR